RGEHYVRSAAGALGWRENENRHPPRRTQMRCVQSRRPLLRSGSVQEARSPVVPLFAWPAGARELHQIPVADSHLRDGPTSRISPHRDDASIIPAASEVAIEDTGNEARMGTHQARVFA